jgi:hypothetical protein
VFKAKLFSALAPACRCILLGACAFIAACSDGVSTGTASVPPPPPPPPVTGPPIDPSLSIARVWNEAILSAIRIDTPRPTVHARNLWHLSAAMYDAWAAYDPTASGFAMRDKTSVADVAVARRESISYAAYRVLTDRYALSASAATTLAELDSLMARLGYDVLVTTTVGNAPAAIGNRAAANVIAIGSTDGSNQAGRYADATYQPVNAPLVVAFPGNSMIDPNSWQALALEVAFSQNGLPEPAGVQSYIGSNWNDVLPFALTRSDNALPYIDVGQPPSLGPGDDDPLKLELMEVVRRSSLLSPDLAARIDISPGAYGNNPLGTNDGQGYSLNPVTGAPYASQLVKAGDFARVLAEYWADGPKSETPPGHWNVIANLVSDSVQATHQFEGRGAPLDRLEWDIKLYFAVNAAVHDAAVTCWGIKRIFTSPRPISLIRYMASQGQSSLPSEPSYNSMGMPLVPDLAELITADTWPNGRHAGIRCCHNLSGDPAPCRDPDGNVGVEVSCTGEVAVHAWPGPPTDRRATYSGTKWLRAKEWVPYQLDTFVTPAFPGFTSGHSTFSRAAAEVLTSFTGSPYFPGGIAEVVVPRDVSLTFEKGPSEDIRVQWATYFDAADQAGQSRLYGGIHINSDDLNGRIAGAEIGRLVFAKASTYFSGTAIALSP